MIFRYIFSVIFFSFLIPPILWWLYTTFARFKFNLFTHFSSHNVRNNNYMRTDERSGGHTRWIQIVCVSHSSMSKDQRVTDQDSGSEWKWEIINSLKWTCVSDWISFCLPNSKCGAITTATSSSLSPCQSRIPLLVLNDTMSYYIHSAKNN